MKFTEKVVRSAGRLGELSDFIYHTETKLQTPLCVIVTKGLSIPHLTNEVLSLVTEDPHIIQVPLNAVVLHETALAHYQRGVAEFMSLKNWPVYCTVADPLSLTRSGYNNTNGVSVWHKRGKEHITPQRYMKLAKHLKVDILQLLCDGDTDENSFKKRITKSIHNTNKFMEECLNLQEDVKTCYQGAVEGGHCINSREKHAEHVASKQKISCYAIDGIHKNGESAENITFTAIQSILKSSLLHLSGVRFLHGAWSPEVVLRCVGLGIDVFDTSLPYLLTERGCALVFPYRLDCTDTTPSSAYYMDLTYKSYSDDFGRVCTGCLCYTCKNHTRAYIYYLLSVKEMQAQVLLMIHNLYHYLEFFKSIREALREDKLPELINLISS